MIFLSPHDKLEEDFNEELLVAESRSDFSLEYLKQETRRLYFEDRVMLIVDASHFIEITRERFESEKSEDIIAFVERWAPMPDSVKPLRDI